MTNLILLNPTNKNTLEIFTDWLISIPAWLVSLNIEWIEIILPGVFTLLGAGLGATLAGVYTIRTMKKQIKYDKTNKDIDLLDNQLKINKRFSTLLSSDIESLDSLFAVIDMGDDTENYNDILILTLESTHQYLEETYQNLSKLNIDNVRYEEYEFYIESLDDNKEIQILCTIQIENFKNIKKNQENGLKDNPFHLNFIGDATEKALKNKYDKIKKNYKSITEKQNELLEKNTNLQEKFKKLT